MRGNQIGESIPEMRDGSTSQINMVYQINNMRKSLFDHYNGERH